MDKFKELLHDVYTKGDKSIVETTVEEEVTDYKSKINEEE